ncbi:MAG: hypothetical protein JXJ22_15180 [Bacteroidales bacterium]|nr:hypothetical protein [Bacteroidales bacterium]
MNELSDYREIWLSRKIYEGPENFLENKLPHLVQKLKKLEKNQYRINLFKTFSVLIILLLFGWLLVPKIADKFMALGLSIIIISTTLFLILYWRSQFSMDKIRILNSSIEVIKDAVKQLQMQKRLFYIHFPLFVFLMLVGLNIIYISLFEADTFSDRVIYHVMGSVFVLLGFIVGISVRRYRFKKELQPVIDELNTLLSDLNSGTTNNML